MAPQDVLGPTIGDLMTLQPLLGSWSSWYDEEAHEDIPDEDHDALAKAVEPLSLFVMDGYGLTWRYGEEAFEEILKPTRWLKKVMKPTHRISAT